MGRLGERIGSFEALAFASLVTALLAIVAVLVVRQSLGAYSAALREPPWLWLGGLMGLIIVFTITFAAPRIGVTATVALVIAGNLVMSTLIDRFGLFGLERIAVTPLRVLGIVLLAVGAFLTLRR